MKKLKQLSITYKKLNFIHGDQKCPGYLCYLVKYKFE